MTGFPYRPRRPGPAFSRRPDAGSLRKGLCLLGVWLPIAVAAQWGATAADASPLQRVAVVGGLSTEPPFQATKVKLGTATRNAFEVPSDFAFEVRPENGCRRVIFSIGVAATGSAAEVEFAIEAGSAGNWRQVYSRAVSAEARGWTDELVTLDRPVAPGESLRFLTRPSSAAGRTAALRPYWGSLLLQSLDDGGTESTSDDGGRQRPNVILISLDTLGAKHVGWYGGRPAVSPSIDELLGRSFTFRQAYAQYPNTLVSHASLFSGLYPNRHQVYGSTATLRSETLAAIMAAHGYMTVGITEDAYVSSDFGFDRGFDWYDDGHHVVDQFPGTAKKTFDKATAWLRRFGNEAPFLLFVHTYEVHTPYVPRDDAARAVVEKLTPDYEGPFRDIYPGGELEVKHNRGTEPIAPRDIDRLLALHASEIGYLDRIFGQFVQEIASQPYANETLVVVFADHGDEFNEHGKIGHGETLHNPVLHVPLAFYWPGRIRAGVEEGRVQLVDVPPTVLDLVGIEPPSGADSWAGEFDGRTLADAIRGGGHVSRPVFAELRSAWASCRELDLPDDCRSEHYMAQTERFKYLTSMIPWTEELYDLRDDPGETRNVADQHPDELKRFRRMMAEYVIRAAPEPDALAPTEQRIDDSGEAAPGLDDVTRERLKALGYNP